jgi:hypothetical protein
MYKVTTKAGEVILCENEDNLDRILNKLGSQFKSCTLLKKSRFASKYSYSIRLKKDDVTRFTERAKQLGLPNFASYIKILLNVDFDHHILIRGEEYASRSKYNYLKS